jgi:hypothetical protein
MQANATTAVVLLLGAALLAGCASHRETMPTREQVYDRPPDYSERPGKHSTTTGRHGTTGVPGGGVDAQSGYGAPTVPPSETNGD